MNKQCKNIYYYLKTITWWQLGDELRVTSTKEQEQRKKETKRAQDSRNYDKTETGQSYSYTDRLKNHPTEDTPRYTYTMNPMSRDSLPADSISNVAENAPRCSYSLPQR